MKNDDKDKLRLIESKAEQIIVSLELYKESQNKLENKVDQIVIKSHEIDKTLTEQHGSLKEHMRRTQAAEQNLDLLRAEVVPIKNHVIRVDGALKMIGLIALGVSLLGGIFKLFSLV